MAEPFIGQIMAFAGNFAPYQWALCQGQLLPIQQYSALFSLLGTAFGGNGTTNFALPNLQGTVPAGQGNGAGLAPYSMGQTAGALTVGLTSSTVPPHSHNFNAESASANSPAPTAGLTLATGNAPGGTRGSTPAPNFSVGTNGTATQLNAAVLTPFTGATTPHANIQPTLAITWCIALAGVFPTRA